MSLSIVVLCTPQKTREIITKMLARFPAYPMIHEMTVHLPPHVVWYTNRWTFDIDIDILISIGRQNVSSRHNNSITTTIRISTH